MRKTLIITFLIVLFGAMFSSCITSRKVNYLQKPDFIIPAYNDTVSYEEYLLKTGDCLYIKVYTLNSDIGSILNGGVGATQQQQILGGASSVADLYTYTVNADGYIQYPLLGDVFVREKTTREVKEILEQRLIAEQLSNVDYASCSVDVRVTRRFFSVIGAGVSGRYAIPKEKINVFEALAMAGDISLYGDRSKVRIVREMENGTEIKNFDVRSANILHSEFYYIEHNDVIYVQTLNEQFFSMSSLPVVLSTTISTFSFAMLIYNFFLKPKTDTK